MATKAFRPARARSLTASAMTSGALLNRRMMLPDTWLPTLTATSAELLRTSRFPAVRAGSPGVPKALAPQRWSRRQRPGHPRSPCVLGVAAAQAVHLLVCPPTCRHSSASSGSWHTACLSLAGEHEPTRNGVDEPERLDGARSARARRPSEASRGGRAPARGVSLAPAPISARGAPLARSRPAPLRGRARTALLAPAMVSRYLDGRPLGPWRYHGVLRGDRNDVVHHEDRRELRGARLLAAWTDHVDQREGNTLSMWRESAGGQGYVLHHPARFWRLLRQHLGRHGAVGMAPRPRLLDRPSHCCRRLDHLRSVRTPLGSRGRRRRCRPPRAGCRRGRPDRPAIAQRQRARAPARPSSPALRSSPGHALRCRPPPVATRSRPPRSAETPSRHTPPGKAGTRRGDQT
jgi:hypothetical protein